MSQQRPSDYDLQRERGLSHRKAVGSLWSPRPPAPSRRARYVPADAVGDYIVAGWRRIEGTAIAGMVLMAPPECRS